MLVLDTVNKTTIWGGTRLQRFGADPLNTRVGSLYTVAGGEDLTCTVLNGEFIGMTLHEVYGNDPARFGCPQFPVFPLLIGLVDATQDLSIQVHPGDDYARAHLGAPFGKTESWVFLAPPSSGSIVCGCSCESREALAEKVSEGAVESVLGRLPVQAGDYVFVETGTLHALTAGCLVYEIQQSTDVTFRFYDYNRLDAKGNPRPLQVEQALAVVDVQKTARAVPYETDRDYEEPYYGTRRTQISGPYCNEREVFACVTLLSGSLTADGMFLTPGMSAIVFPGETAHFAGSAEVMVAWPRGGEAAL
ncbi:MAG: type I phosphomannose isomerase catalytic subunit [Candidatus Spyradocola sp.]|jgi:mannose-6-phosphate isomerase